MPNNPKIDLEAAKAAVDKQMLSEGIENSEKFAQLFDMIPTSLEQPQKRTVLILDATAKSLIIAYAFIGLSEIVAKSSGVTREFIWDKCVERAIHNLQKDGLFN